MTTGQPGKSNPLPFYSLPLPDPAAHTFTSIVIKHHPIQALLDPLLARPLSAQCSVVVFFLTLTTHDVFYTVGLLTPHRR